MDGAQHEAIRRRFIEERYRLMPYIYGLAEENSRDGLPILRPVFLEFPATLDKDWDHSGQPEQFMLGDDLLIAPPVFWGVARALHDKIAGTGLVRLFDRTAPECGANDGNTAPRSPAGVRASRVHPGNPAAGAKYRGNAAGSSRSGCLPGCRLRGAPLSRRRRQFCVHAREIPAARDCMHESRAVSRNRLRSTDGFIQAMVDANRHPRSWMEQRPATGHARRQPDFIQLRRRQRHAHDDAARSAAAGAASHRAMNVAAGNGPYRCVRPDGPIPLRSPRPHPR